jgi:hypothetical protein
MFLLVMDFANYSVFLLAYYNYYVFNGIGRTIYEIYFYKSIWMQEAFFGMKA